MNTLNSTHSPSPFARILAPIARLSQRVQNRIAEVFKLKNSRTASAVILATGLAVAGIFGPVAPVLHTAGVATTALGAGGLAGDALEREVATWDGDGGGSQKNH